MDICILSLGLLLYVLDDVEMEPFLGIRYKMKSSERFEEYIKYIGKISISLLTTFVKLTKKVGTILRTLVYLSVSGFVAHTLCGFCI